MTNPSSILASAKTAKIRHHLEFVGFIAVLHWHLAGARHPTPIAFSEYEDFMQYLTESTKPGDAIDVWPFPSENNQRIAEGKMPNEDGTIHQSGVY